MWRPRPFRQSDCDARTFIPTGSLEKDVIGIWDSFGIDSRVVFNFHPDGGTDVEGPNQYAPHGGIGHLQYRVLDGGLAI